MSSLSSVGSGVISQAMAGPTRRHHHHDEQGFEQAFNAAAKSMGVEPSKVDDLRKQVEQAVKEVKDGSKGRGTRQAVGDAIDRVLKDNGIDPSKFHEAMKTQFDTMRHSNLHVGPHAGMMPPPPHDDGDQPPPAITAVGGVDTMA